MRRSLVRAAVLLGLTAAGAAGSAQAGLTNVDIGINPTYAQTGPGTVTPTGGFFAARAFMASPNDFDGGSLTYPGAGSPAPLTPQPGSLLGYSVGSASLASLNAAFPFGTYTFNVTNSMTSASQTATINYSVAADSLSIPQLDAASYNGLQGLNPTAGFTFNFNAFLQNPNANLAFVFLNVFNSGGTDVFSQGFLSPSTTSIFMPGGTLAAGQGYTFDLLFDERITGTDGTTPNTIFFDTHTGGAFTTSAVPEPEAWTMLVLGLGGLGAILRRRTSRAGARA
jgi:hypothetical protein